MNVVLRLRNIVLQPVREWPVIAREPATEAGLIRRYVAPLAAIGPICSFVAHVWLRHEPLPIAGISAIFAFMREIAWILTVGGIAASVAKSFGAEQDKIAAVKLVAYAWTPRWLAGVFALIPAAYGPAVAIATAYGFYLLYTGVEPLVRVPPEKSTLYTLIVVVTGAIVLAIVTIVVAVVYDLLTGVAMSSLASFGMR